MSKRFVMDTGAITLFFAGDRRVTPYFDAIMEERAAGYVCSVNLAEYFYKTCQKLGFETAKIRYHQISARLQRVDTDENLSEAAGKEKCHNGKLSLADSFALALARQMDACLLTTDSELRESKTINVKYFAIGK